MHMSIHRSLTIPPGKITQLLCQQDMLAAIQGSGCDQERVS
jgi:hypothetical protein